MYATTTKVLVIDDHPFYLEGLKVGLSAIEGLRCRVETACSAHEVLGMYRDFSQFDLLLCDLNLPQLDGIGFLNTLSERGVSTPVAILSSSNLAQDMYKSLASGAAGYLYKGATLAEFARALRMLLAGQRYLAPQLLGETGSPSANPAESAMKRLGITQRQYDVLQLLAEGMSNRQMSEMLRVKETTVKSHLQALFQALGVSNRTACLCRAGTLGLLPDSELA
ncbi:MAG: response regulator transcription factor [Oleiphilaceae bacterium]|nr:response regulator transcription factor [Oleiphilaceae bacterium]